ncbi:MAG: CPBP family intramembrane metalloprotease [Oscillospiraceae bacterium]|nr:CPBP family intramembrane metalloprotease [Oscillospiraceae bacterium]
MNDKQICAQLRQKFGTVGLALLMYYGIMNAAVILVCVGHTVLLILSYLLTDPKALLSEAVMNSVLDSVINNGWGYLLATLIGSVLLLMWKKRQFCFRDIWVQQKPMKAGSFFMLLTIFISAQALVQFTAAYMEWFFGIFDISVMDALEEMSVTGDSLSMFLYACIAAPLFEEVIFRGYVLRKLEPYGRKFAILGSAFLFGIFHGNILQTPFAFVVGLILGYVTLEYSIVWAMLLHLINNLILGDSLTRIMQLLPPWVGELIFAAVIWGSFLGAVIILIVKRKQVFACFSGPKIHPLCLKSFFTSPGILILTGVMLCNIFLSVLMMIIGQI